MYTRRFGTYLGSNNLAELSHSNSLSVTKQNKLNEGLTSRNWRNIGRCQQQKKETAQLLRYVGKWEGL